MGLKVVNFEIMNDEIKVLVVFVVNSVRRGGNAFDG